MNKKSVFRLCAIAYAFLIFYISSLSRPITLPPIPSIDKIIHFFEFGFLGYLVFNSLFNSNLKKTEIISIGLSSIYAGTDEIHQYFVPGRFCDWLDFFVDVVGIIIVVLMLSYFQKGDYDQE